MTVEEINAYYQKLRFEQKQLGNKVEYIQIMNTVYFHVNGKLSSEKEITGE